MIKMIKGVNKNVVVIKNLKNDIFEEAIFILKPERKKPRKSGCRTRNGKRHDAKRS